MSVKKFFLKYKTLLELEIGGESGKELPKVEGRKEKLVKMFLVSVGSI